jgi:hypothetical protein
VVGDGGPLKLLCQGARFFLAGGHLKAALCPAARLNRNIEKAHFLPRRHRLATARHVIGKA